MQSKLVNKYIWGKSKLFFFLIPDLATWSTKSSTIAQWSEIKITSQRNCKIIFRICKKFHFQQDVIYSM